MNIITIFPNESVEKMIFPLKLLGKFFLLFGLGRVKKNSWRMKLNNCTPHDFIFNI